MDIVFDNFRGGRNGIDSPLDLHPNQCQEAMNVDWFESAVGGKRRGATFQSSSGDTPFSGGIYSMFRHIPGSGIEADAQWWAVDSTGWVKRMANSTAWEDVALDDAMTGLPQHVDFASFNGKLFMAYESDENRLHVHDPLIDSETPAGPKVRRAGLAAPDDPPTAADEGGGTYPPVLRYYRVRVIQYDATKEILVRRSEPSASVSITPSGTGAGVTITFPTPPGEWETHWEVEVSLDDSTWFVGLGLELGTQVPIATTSVNDTYDTAVYDLLPTSEEIGEFTLPPSARFLSTDNNRLLMGSNFDADFPTSRIHHTPVLGTSDHGDDERVQITSSVKGYTNLNEKDGGMLTGLSMPIHGTVFAFKYTQTHKLVPTGDNTKPYIPRQLSNVVGCIHFKTIVMAEDASGNPAVYFLSGNGPYRVTPIGYEALGRDIEDQWYGRNTKAGQGVYFRADDIVAHGLYHRDKHQIWWHLAVGRNDSPSIRVVLDVRQAVMRDQYGVRGGWSIHTGKSCKAFCAVMFSEHLDSERMSPNLVPYISYKEPT